MTSREPRATVSILVVGNALREGITRTEDQKRRTQTGGAGALIARSLAQAGYPVTLLAGYADDDHHSYLRTELEECEVRLLLHPSPGAVAVRETRVTQGEPVNTTTNFPASEPIPTTALAAAGKHDWAVLTMSPRLEDRVTLQQNSQRLAITATHPALAQKMLHLTGARLATLNVREARKLLEHRQEATLADIAKLLDVPTILLTQGSRGWSIYQKDEGRTKSAALKPPQIYDYIGAGDAATAGLIHATISGRDQTQTVNASIRERLLDTEAGYANEARRKR